MKRNWIVFDADVVVIKITNLYKNILKNDDLERAMANILHSTQSE